MFLKTLQIVCTVSSKPFSNGRKILGEEAAPYVLAFYQKNKDIFERWDPMHCANFYTLEYQAHNLIFVSSSCFKKIRYHEVLYLEAKEEQLHENAPFLSVVVQNLVVD